MAEIDFSVLDASELFSYEGLVSMIGEGGYMKVCEAFYADISQLYAEKYASADDDSVESNRRFAHRIKGSAGNIGAKKLSLLAADVEQRLSNGEAHSIRELLTELKEVLDTLAVFRSENGRYSQAGD